MLVSPEILCICTLTHRHKYFMAIFPRPVCQSSERVTSSQSESDPDLVPCDSYDESLNGSDSGCNPESEYDSVMGEPIIQEFDCACPDYNLDSELITDVLEIPRS